MEIAKKEEKGLMVISVSGRLDTLTAQDFEKQCLGWLAEEKKNLVLDFSGLEYVSSAGLRCVLVVGKKAKANGNGLSLCGLTGLVQEVFSMSGFDSFFPVYDNLNSLLEGK